MSWPDPWPKAKEEVRRLQLADPYDRYLNNRVNVIEELFRRDSSSIDGIALCMVSLNALAWYRYTSTSVPASDRVKKSKHQEQFRRLVVEHTSFENRMSIPELVRALRKCDEELKAYESHIRHRFQVHGMSLARQPSEDPPMAVFENWANKNGLVLPRDFPGCDHAGCIFRHYRNSVIHELRIAKGKDAGYFGETAHETPIYYMNFRGRIGAEVVEDEDERALRHMNEDPVNYMRFGIKPTYLLQLLHEAIASLRQWSLKNDFHLLEDADE